MKENNKDKKVIIIIVGVILLIISIIAIYLSTINNQNNPSEDLGNNIPSNENNNVYKLENENTYFAIQNTINNYYMYLSNQDNENVYSVLEDSYKKENNITINNVSNSLNNNYQDVTFLIKEIYYKRNNDTYYFINGYLFSQNILGTYYGYEKSVNILVIADNSNHYVIRPLNDVTTLKNYAENYVYNNVSIKNNKIIKFDIIKEEYKLQGYISEFINLLSLDIDRAYNMLDNKTKSSYGNINNFQNDKNNILNNLTSYVFSYSKNELDEYIEYQIKDKNDNNITIIEYNIMDFKIGFDY